MLIITLISNKNSMLREWRNAFSDFSEVKILKGSISVKNSWKVLEINSNGLISKENLDFYNDLYISKRIINCDYFHISNENIIKEKNLILVPTSVNKNATFGYSTYIPMFNLLNFLNEYKEIKAIYISSLGELNSVSEYNIANDMSRAYRDFKSQLF